MFDFAKELKNYLQKEFITGEKDWGIKGFIDAKKKIYPISLDTKLLSKILGIIYSRRERINEKRVYNLDELPTIKSVITDLEIILQEKYKIANFLPGSGNTANIGSITNLEKLRNGTGPFAGYVSEVFEDYWRNYLRNEDAERMGIKRPYRNLEEYLRWKKRQGKKKK